MENSRKIVVMNVVVIIGWLSLYPLVVIGDPMLHKVEGPMVHKVGGSKGWKPDVNYTEWSSHEHFYVNDWLKFNFDKHLYTVLEVNKTSYENCIDRNFIKNFTRGGRDVVELKEARTYYYLSSGGYCFHGMRVAVHVEEHQHAAALAPAPSEMKSGSILPSVYTCIWIIVANVIYVNLVQMGTL
ncbi:early nodulin-like protein 19 [Gastrolobium bilobum]|uniref:early nodulin-like protein 19 n=1 Tax=Gastrolobium bilobum TaxID=150636 RepID=UPI002AB20BBE|nr:early nodulin-like protein 19 [Gastrolobium bilobum]